MEQCISRIAEIASNWDVSRTITFYSYYASHGALTDLDLTSKCFISFLNMQAGPPGVLVSRGEGLSIFRQPRSTANYFREAGEQAHTFGDLGSSAKK